MNRLLASVCLTAIGVSSAMAHHAFSMFDDSKTATVQGTVRAFQFTYPHTWLWVDVLGDQGGVVSWGFESAGPAELNSAAGWTRSTLHPGDKVSVTFCPLRSGQPGGSLVSVTRPDGKTVKAAASPCARKQGAAKS